MLFLNMLIVLAACTRSAPPGSSLNPNLAVPMTVAVANATPNPLAPPTRDPNAPILTPTPDAPHPIPTLRSGPEQYVVQPGDTLNQIAQRYNVSVEAIAEASSLVNINWLDVGQVLTIPVPLPLSVPADFKIIPDSELVYGPYAASFDVADFVRQQGGYLAQYRETVDDVTLAGAAIVRKVALDNSVNPRLLLAILEYQSGWVTQAAPASETLDYPIGLADPNRAGLYRQLFWAANELNRGYYRWRAAAVSTWSLADGAVVAAAPTINAGTAGLQHLFAQFYGLTGWQKVVSAYGFVETYRALFGYPFDYAYEPLLPFNLQQPPMQLPFEPLEIWAFTGGPHGAWGDGAAWGALDFAPPGDALGCVLSPAWVVAVADGLVVRAENGAVMQDLDGDGLEQTGWNVLYMHIDSRDRVRPSTYLHAGERIGHPSCEGGFSTGTHLHLARKYNGEWISADGALPFVLDGWVSSGTGVQYDGYLRRNGQVIEAWNGRTDGNEIQR
ncbi:MAG: hypothetical protein Fur0018_17130 [Anaerolineales bacterium]